MVTHRDWTVRVVTILARRIFGHHESMNVSTAVVLAIAVLCITGAAIAITMIRGWVESIRIREGKDHPMR